MTSEPEQLRDLLGDLGGKLGLASPNEVGKVWARWAEIVGPAIADHADPTSLRGGVLRIRVDSPTWATELGYLAGEIRDRINRAVATELVREVRVWIAPREDRRSGRGSEHARTPSATRHKTPSEDPREALERAREAWSKSSGGGFGEPLPEGPENQEKRS